MKFRKGFAVLATVLVVAETMTFAYQKDAPSTMPQTKQEQLVPVEFINPDELKTKISKNEPMAIVDLRATNLYAQSEKTIRGSVHTKVRRVAHRLREVPRDRDVITYCACPADEAAIIAARALLANGFKRVRVLKGGWNAWLQASGQLQPNRR